MVRSIFSQAMVMVGILVYCLRSWLRSLEVVCLDRKVLFLFVKDWLVVGSGGLGMLNVLGFVNKGSMAVSLVFGFAGCSRSCEGREQVSRLYGEWRWILGLGYFRGIFMRRGQFLVFYFRFCFYIASYFFQFLGVVLMVSFKERMLD